VQNRYLLRAFYLAGFGIAAMAETFLIGLVHHAQDTSSCLQLTLRQQSELSHFGTCPLLFELRSRNSDALKFED
jgi:hypothetical protein